MSEPIFFEKVLRWLLVLPVALLAGALGGVVTLVCSHLFLWIPVVTLLGIVHWISGGYPPSPWELSDKMFAVVVRGLGPTMIGLAFVHFGTSMAPTRSSADKVVAVMLCGVVIASPLVAPVTALLMGEGKGLLDSNAYTVPWWGWMFGSLGAVSGALLYRRGP